MTTGTMVGGASLGIYTDEDIAKARKDRERELVSLENGFLHLFTFTEVSLALAAPFLSSDEIKGRAFSKVVTAVDSPGVAWEFMLNFSVERSSSSLYKATSLNTFTSRGWSYSFSVIFHSPVKYVKFYLNDGSSPSFIVDSWWDNFKEFYFESQGEFYIPMVRALQETRSEVKDFFVVKAKVITQLENADWGHVFGTNAIRVADLADEHRRLLEYYNKFQRALLLYESLTFETCHALRETKGFVKSKKLAEIRENLEKRSKEIGASVNR